MSTDRPRPRLNQAGIDPVATGRPAPEPAVETEEALAPTGAADVAEKRRSRRRPRAGEPRAITFWVLPEVFAVLKDIAFKEGKTMREIMTEAVADYVRKKRQLSIVKVPPARG